jgi:hypothetical protein
MLMVFLSFSCRENDQKGDKTKSKKKMALFFSTFLSSFGLPEKVLTGVFELPLLRNAQKRHTQNSKKKRQKKAPTYYLPSFSGYLSDLFQISNIEYTSLSTFSFQLNCS